MLMHDRGSVETSMAEQYTLSEDTIECAEGALCHAIEENARARELLSESVQFFERKSCFRIELTMVESPDFGFTFY